MPATFILLPALVVGLIAWLVASVYTRRNAREGSRDKVQRLRNHALWLEQRLDLARRERWDRDMIVSLSDQLGVACHELARARRSDHRRATTSTHR
jgi:hypothetical protein